MEEKRKGRSGTADGPPDPAVVETEELDSGEEQEQGPVVVASAKSIPRPLTSLSTLLKSDVNKITVTLLSDPASVTSLDDVLKINNRSDTSARTPLMTVIQAVLVQGGGKMKLAELTEKVRGHWNRPLPSSPYTPQEFVYVMVRNSDNISVSE
jgi:hypothetical protein